MGSHTTCATVYIAKFVFDIMSRSTRKPTLWTLLNVSIQISMSSPRRLIPSQGDTSIET